MSWAWAFSSPFPLALVDHALAGVYAHDKPRVGDDPRELECDFTSTASEIDYLVSGFRIEERDYRGGVLGRVYKGGGFVVFGR